MDRFTSRFSFDEFYITKFGFSEKMNDIRKHNHYKIAISQTYFAFTSLATIGFGDFHPRSDYERIMGSVILLLGVSMFSYMMSKFI